MATSEKEAALAAVPTDAPTIFDKIIKREIPSTVVYEDDKALAFRDITPQAPTHILIIPKVKDGLTGLSKAEERHIEILGHLLYIAKVVAKQEGLEEGFRIVINDGPNGCQSVQALQRLALLLLQKYALVNELDAHMNRVFLSTYPLELVNMEDVSSCISPFDIDVDSADEDEDAD
ncbi:hypothetical protein ZIOFF_026870 [Zingiber officinale]|uniref:HIT domain-containing protein n=1 Tax=Zingiber officinale TaxID=94328 RepID=A0A8J5H5E7_ZINOF|nr:hypothetical protein ZIOFF_026870 [Zingiber officinale]